MGAHVHGGRGATLLVVLLVACSSSSKKHFPSGSEQGGSAGVPPTTGGAVGGAGGAQGGSSGASANGFAGSAASVGGAGTASGTGGGAGSSAAGRASEAGTGGGDEKGGSGDVGAGGIGGACGEATGDCAQAVCAAVKHVEVPLDLFGDVRDQHTVVRMDDRFALYATGRALQKGGADVAFVSWDGVDAHDHFELDNPCPGGVCTTILGTSAVSTPAGSPQLIMTDDGTGAAMSTYPVRAVAWDAAQASPPIVALFEAPADFMTISELASSKDGKRAVFAAGQGGGPVHIAELGPSAELVAPASTLTPPQSPWDCLDVVPTQEGAAVSLVVGGADDTAVVWILRELAADGNVALTFSAPVPAGAALGYTGCPTVAESPVGFHGIWTANDNDSIMATVLRQSAPDTPPTVTTFPKLAGSMLGGRSDMLVFLVAMEDGRVGFRGIDQNGHDVAKLYELPPLPESTTAHRRTFPMLLSVEGSSLYVSYELETTRVIEQVVCD